MRSRTGISALALAVCFAISTLGCGSSGGGTSDGAATLPECTSTSDNSPAMPPETFCTIFLAVCGTTHAGLGSMSECLATYSALTTTKPVRQQCQSEHLCTAESMTGDNRANHCTHAGADPGNMVCIQDN
jgi:hypothetical protein